MLLILGVAWIAFGAEALGLPPAAYLYHEIYISTPAVRGGAWITAGLTAIAAAFRPIGFKDTYAWPILYVMPAVRAVMYLVAWFDYLLGAFGGPGYGPGWIYAIMFAAMAGVVGFLSGWPEPYVPEIVEEKLPPIPELPPMPDMPEIPGMLPPPEHGLNRGQDR